MADQDWKPVVIRPKKTNNNTKTAVRAAQQQTSGSSVETQKKAAPANKQRSTDYDVRKLDQDDGEEAGYQGMNVVLFRI